MIVAGHLRRVVPAHAHGASCSLRSTPHRRELSRGGHSGRREIAVHPALITSASFVAGGIAAYIVGHVVFDLRAERDTVLDRLLAAEGTLHAAFETAQSGMAILDLDGNFRRVNPAMCDILGRDEASLLRTSWMSYVHPEDRNDHVSRVAALAAGEVASFQEECRLCTRDQREVWSMVGLSAVRGGTAPEYLFAHVTDIADRVTSETRLRQSEAHYRNMFDLSPVPVWRSMSPPSPGRPQRCPGGRLGSGGGRSVAGHGSRAECQ